jgi:hypothetical protein
VSDFYNRPMRHHTLDCNEGAIYNGGKCECSTSCAAELVGTKRRPQDTHVCDRLSGHDGSHKCGCGETWT